MEVKQINRRTDYRIAIIGLGYVGLPLAIAFAKAGRNVVGVDLDTRKISQLAAGNSYIPDVPTSDVKTVSEAGNFCATTDYDMLRDREVITPFTPASSSHLIVFFRIIPSLIPGRITRAA